MGKERLMMNGQRNFIFILILFSLIGNEAWSQTNEEGRASYTMEEIVVTSEKMEVYVKNYPQEVKMVKRAEIVQRNLPNVEEVLKTIPGVEVYPSSGIGSRISIRGSGKSGGVLILLNGRPLNSNQHGNLDLNTIPIDSVESVSVFKPPVPVWLGAGGSDGAINIVTRDLKPVEGKKEPQTTIKIGGGSFGLIEGAANRQVAAKGGNALLSAAIKHKDGKRTNSDRNDGSVGLTWNRIGQEGNRYDVNGRYYQAEYGSPGPTDNETLDARQLYRKGSLDVRYKGAIGEKGSVAAVVYGDAGYLRDKAQSGAIYRLNDNKVGLKVDTTWSQKDGLWDLRLGGLSEWNGFDHTLTGDHNRIRNGLSAQYDRRFGTVTATIGLRGDVTNDFGFQPGLSTGAAWRVTPKYLLKARAGYTVNVPTFEQLFQTTHGSIDQSRGNPNLQEERIGSYDLSWEYVFEKDWSIQATLFRADTWDLISALRGVDKIYRPINIPRAERQGVELSGKYGWGKNLILEANMLLQDSGNSDTGKELPYTPSAKLKGTVRYTMPDAKTLFEGCVRYEGVRYSQTENLPSQQLDAYVTIDVKVTQPFTVKGVSADVYAKIDNLLNAQYQNHYGYPDDGIRASAGFQVKF
ncbi:MAG TPA: TonB-dependent receptor [Syntrophaceae bacterium]|nr:TonB-dependent receptor [Syntrophaceae bacterium]HCX01455.1 TonB-dependent receptor [Syntrophaceae bacterium]